MIKRKYGDTGVELSVIGFGGIICTNESPKNAEIHVGKAIDRGINYFDVAPSYGNAQEILGLALEPYRNDVFLACKTGERTADEAVKELNESLKLLRTDHVDLYQLHGVSTMADVETILGPGGAIEAVEKAQKEGKIRYAGFSAHSERAALALLDQYNFNSVLFPINWVVWHESDFGPAVVKKAQEKGVAVLALKALARRKRIPDEVRKWPKCWYIPVESYEEAEYAARFTLSRPITAAVSPGHHELLWWACDAADGFTPLTVEEETLVAKRAEGIEPIFPKEKP